MRLLDALAVIVGAVALVGSIISIYFLTIVGAALSTFTESATETGLTGVEGVPQMLGVLNLIMVFGWVWSLSVLVSSIYTVWSGIGKIRGKK